MKEEDLEQRILANATGFYLEDRSEKLWRKKTFSGPVCFCRNCPISFEPSGNDFLSPCIQVSSLPFFHCFLSSESCPFGFTLSSGYSFSTISSQLVFWSYWLPCWQCNTMTLWQEADLMARVLEDDILFRCHTNMFNKSSFITLKCQDFKQFTSTRCLIWNNLIFRDWLFTFLPQLFDPDFILEPGVVRSGKWI